MGPHSSVGSTRARRLARSSMSTDIVLQRINSARDYLEKAKTAQEAHAVIAVAEAAGIFAKRMKASDETLNYATEIRLRAERKLGEILKASEKAPAGRPAKIGSNSEPISKPPTHAQLGIDKKLAARAQALADVPAKKFEAALTAPPGIVLSAPKVRTMLDRDAKEDKRESSREKNRAVIASTPEPAMAIAAGARFSTIMIDPPWDWGDEGDQDQLGRARPTYGTMSIEQLLAMDAPRKLADTDCHLYLWITNRSLPKGFALLEAWGFRYVTCLTWCKPSFGMGNYFRGQTEQVLFGVKGSQPLKRKDVGTWFAAPRGPQHSSKPESFYALVESCSPGPYLEMFSRSNRKGWTHWGADAK